MLEPVDYLPCPRSCRGGTSRCSSTCATDRQPRQYTDSLTAVGMRLQITVRRVLGRTARRTVGCPPIYADAFGFPAPPGSRRVVRHHDLLPIAKHSVRTQPGDKAEQISGIPRPYRTLLRRHGRSGALLLDPRSAQCPLSRSLTLREWGDADASAETTSAAAPARRDLGAELCPTAAPQHSLIVAVAVHHPDSIERRARPCRSLRRCAVCAASLVGYLVA